MKRVLVANRGEIALRVMKTLRRMNIESVAVYSDADRNAPHVIYADFAVHIGPPASSESYLVIDKIIEAAKDKDCDAVHPGYGFLSENAVFAQKLSEAGIILIGPSPNSMKIMGSKLAAKEAVAKFDIPMVPGSAGAIEDMDEAKKTAEAIGYPVLVKASAGGGGKGMRIVEHSEEFEEQVKRAMSEAVSSFGDGAVFIEKYIKSPRHIEIQVVADQHGGVVHLMERECSIQRRHQKVVEEAPSAVLTPELREAMGRTATDVARSCDYIGAGTVEFLLDENMKYYFLEMNTRLQVEHPVTEMITGVDLVEWQIRVARGERIPLDQSEIKIKGHSLELRVYAEDSTEGFAPSTGTLEIYKPPKGKGIRVDDGFREGMEVSIYYDPMISKLIVWAESRSEAIELMKAAIQDYKIEGVKTTLDFGNYVFNHEAFISGKFDTHFVKKHYSVQEDSDEKLDSIAALGALYFFNERKNRLRLPHQS